MLKRSLCIIFLCIILLLAAGSCKKVPKSNQIPERATEENSNISNTQPGNDIFQNIKFNIYDNNKIPGSVQILRDIDYGKSGNRALKLNIIRPEKQTIKPLPVILWVHGGGWESGSKDDQTGMLAGYAEQGYLCASIQYRFIDEEIFPAQLEDCKTAVRFLRANAELYNLNPEKIGAWGASAGGHLVSLLGTTGGISEMEGSGGWQEYSSSVQAVCDWFGPVAFGNEALPADNNISRFIGGTPQEYRERAAKADPVTYVSADDPPILIMHGDKDTTVPFELSQMFYNVLKNKGVDTSLNIISGAGHWFVDMSEFEAVLEFFNKYLKDK